MTLAIFRVQEYLPRAGLHVNQLNYSLVCPTTVDSVRSPPVHPSYPPLPSHPCPTISRKKLKDRLGFDKNLADPSFQHSVVCTTSVHCTLAGTAPCTKIVGVIQAKSAFLPCILFWIVARYKILSQMLISRILVCFLIMTNLCSSTVLFVEIRCFCRLIFLIDESSFCKLGLTLCHP